MIHAVKKLDDNWFYQEFTPEHEDDSAGCNLYDANGDFVEEFDSYKDMKNYIERSCAT